MKHIVTFSGGKDSTALVLWAKENLPEFTTVFCDTGWESEITYGYIKYINEKLLDGKLLTIRSDKYPGGMRDLVAQKGVVPSSQRRFCTAELKVLPMIAWLKEIDDHITVYQGIRAEESRARSNMKPSEYSDDYDALIVRPLFHWTHEEVFALHKKYDVAPNPMYLLGARRVGCFPCVMVARREMKALLRSMPEVRHQIRVLEAITGKTFFPPDYIPDSAKHSKTRDPKTGVLISYADEVFRYLTEVEEQQLPLLPVVQCMSAYNLCE